MDDDTLEQRIRYLIEHGGVYDDPLAELRRGVRWAIALAGGACVLTVMQMAQVYLQ